MERPQRPHRLLLFSALCAFSILLSGHVLATTFALALRDDAYTHILLILPLSLSLTYLSQNELPVESSRTNLVAWVVIVLALIIASLAQITAVMAVPGAQLAIRMFALVSFWIGSVVLCFGARAFRRLAFPLCFLYLLVPMPGFVLDEIVYFLQLQSAFAARILFGIARVPVVQDGIILSVRNFDIEVAQECSSIRSSLFLVITTIFLAYLFLSTWWRRLLFVVIAIPLSIMKNGLRIFTIAELGTGVDPAYFDSWLHHHGGFIFFAIALAIQVALLWVLRRTERREGSLQKELRPQAAT